MRAHGGFLRVTRHPLALLCVGLGLMLTVRLVCPEVLTAAPVAALRLVPAPDTPSLVDDGDFESLRESVRQNLVWLSRRPGGRKLGFGPRTVTVTEQARSLTRLLDLLVDDPTPDSLAQWILREFEVYQSVGGPDGSMLVTGYYEPIVEAALSPSPEYTVPVWGVPSDLQVSVDSSGRRVIGRLEGERIVPYWSRAEIEAGRLASRAVALAWARDPVDVFYMEVEGSGTLRLPDGREIRVGHAATNGRPYRSIGRLLIDERKIEEEAMSMPAIRAWLAAHPEHRARVMRHNESYVFFRWLGGPPVGSLGVPLTPGRSIATDARLFPRGALAFIRTARPRAAGAGEIVWEPVSRFALNQDTGGAMRGPGRVDVFWGRGPEAELAAGLMKQPGELYFLVPRIPEEIVVGPPARLPDVETPPPPADLPAADLPAADLPPADLPAADLPPRELEEMTPE